MERELGRWVTVITKVCAKCNLLVAFDIPLMLLYVHTDHRDKGEPRMATSTFTQLLNSDQNIPVERKA